jgi:hypothetical protein
MNLVEFMFVACIAEIISHHGLSTLTTVLHITRMYHLCPLSSKIEPVKKKSTKLNVLGNGS